MRYPKYTIVTIHAHGSPYVLIVEGRGPWTVFWDVMFCYVSCLLFIRLFNININVLDVIINDSP
jgi:hypothetical protein